MWKATDLSVAYQKQFFAKRLNDMRKTLRDPNGTANFDYTYTAVLIEESLRETFYSALVKYLIGVCYTEEIMDRKFDIMGAYPGTKPRSWKNSAGKKTPYKDAAGNTPWIEPSSEWLTFLKDDIMYVNTEVVKRFVIDNIINNIQTKERVLEQALKKKAITDIDYYTEKQQMDNIKLDKELLLRAFASSSYIPASLFIFGYSMVKFETKCSWKFEDVKSTFVKQDGVYFFSGLSDNGLYQLSKTSFNVCKNLIMSSGGQRTEHYKVEFDPEQFFHAFNLR